MRLLLLLATIYVVLISPRLRRGALTPGSLFSQFHAALHLAHKYQCADVETRVLFVLKKYYTANFAGCDMNHNDESLKFTPVCPPPQAAIAAINIARLAQTPSMLPYAMYLAANQEGRMMDGYKRRDGSVEHLSAEDLRQCIDARGALAREMASLVKHVFDPIESAGCKTTNACAETRAVIFDSVELNVPGDISVLQPYTDCIDEWTDLNDLCGPCRRGMLERDVEARRAVWKSLPGIFGLKAEECGFPSVEDL